MVHLRGYLSDRVEADRAGEAVFERVRLAEAGGCLGQPCALVGGLARERTDGDSVSGRCLGMEFPTDASVLAVERLNDGIVVKFSDGTCAYYSAALLYAQVFRAVLLQETDVAW